MPTKLKTIFIAREGDKHFDPKEDDYFIFTKKPTYLKNGRISQASWNNEVTEFCCDQFEKATGIKLGQGECVAVQLKRVKTQ